MKATLGEVSLGRFYAIGALMTAQVYMEISHQPWWSREGLFDMARRCALWPYYLPDMIIHGVAHEVAVE